MVQCSHLLVLISRPSRSSTELLLFLSLSHLPQTCHDPLRVAVRPTSLPNRGGGRKCVSGAAGGSAAEPHRSEDAESSGASGGDAAAGQTLASLMGVLKGSKTGFDSQELQKAKAERERGGGSPYLKGVDSPRLHHLRGADSAHSRSVLESMLRTRVSQTLMFLLDLCA